MHKKSQGLSMNVIIMAAIGLVILVVLISIFSGRAGIFSRNVGGSCTDQGGTCLNGKESCSEIEGKPIKIIASGCKDKTGKEDSGPCCLPLK